MGMRCKGSDFPSCGFFPESDGTIGACRGHSFPIGEEYSCTAWDAKGTRPGQDARRQWIAIEIATLSEDFQFNGTTATGWLLFLERLARPVLN